MQDYPKGISQNIDGSFQYNSAFPERAKYDYTMDILARLNADNLKDSSTWTSIVAGMSSDPKLIIRETETEKGPMTVASIVVSYDDNKQPIYDHKVLIGNTWKTLTDD